MLVCPFTKKKLRLLDSRELEQLNTGIQQGNFYFYEGVPVNFTLKKAYSANNQIYIYPVVDEVVFLKKRTSIVPKNRTRNPHKRVLNDVADAFYEEFGFKPSRKSVGLHQLMYEPLPLEQLNEFQTMLPKLGGTFISLAVNDVETTHHLIFGKKFDHHIHIDHSFARMKAVLGQLVEETLYILSDEGDLPLSDCSVDAVLASDFIEDGENFQKLSYTELKRNLKPHGVAIVLDDLENLSPIRNSYNADKFIRKLLRYFIPWKKQFPPSFHFHAVKRYLVGEGKLNLEEKSFRRQLSS